MPLHHGRTTKGIKTAIGKNIKTELRAGTSRKQSIAIAMNTARRDAQKAGIKPSRVGVSKK